MSRSLNLAWPTRQLLIVSKSRSRALFNLIFGLGVLFACYVWIFGWVPPDPDHLVRVARELTANEPFMWLLVLFALLFVPSLIRSVKVLARGDSFAFDGEIGAVADAIADVTGTKVLKKE